MDTSITISGPCCRATGLPPGMGIDDIELHLEAQQGLDGSVELVRKFKDTGYVFLKKQADVRKATQMKHSWSEHEFAVHDFDIHECAVMIKNFPEHSCAVIEKFFNDQSESGLSAIKVVFVVKLAEDVHLMRLTTTTVMSQILKKGKFTYCDKEFTIHPFIYDTSATSEGRKEITSEFDRNNDSVGNNGTGDNHGATDNGVGDNHGDELYEEFIPSCSAIITGAPRKTTRNLLEKFIKSKSRCSPLEVEEVEDVEGEGDDEKSWVVVMPSVDACEKLLKVDNPTINHKSFTIKGLSARRCPEVSGELCPYSLLLTHYISTISDDDIILTIEATLGDSLDETRTQISRCGTRMKLILKSEIKADLFKKLQEELQRAPIELTFMIGVQRLRRSFELYAFSPEDIELEFMQLHFTSPKFGGNDDVEVQQSRVSGCNMSIIKVKATDEKCLGAILKCVHKFGKTVLHFDVFYPEFGLPANSELAGALRSPAAAGKKTAKKLELPPEFLYPVEERLLCNFLMEKISDLQLELCTVASQTQNGILFRCRLDAENCTEDQARKWHPAIEVALESLQEIVVLEKIDVEKRYLPVIKDELDEDDFIVDLSIDFSKNLDQVLLLGEKKTVSLVKKSIVKSHKELLKKEKEDLEVTTMYHNCPPLKAKLLGSIFEKKDEIKVQYEEREKRFVLQGKQIDVTSYKVDLQSYLSEFNIVRIPFDRLFVTLLRRKCVFEEVESSLLQKQMAIDIVDDENVILCINGEESSSAKNYLQNLFVHDSIPLAEGVLPVFGDLKKFLEQLVNKSDGYFAFSLSNTTLTVAVWAVLNNEVRRYIRNWLEKNTIYHEEIAGQVKGKIMLLRAYAASARDELGNCQFRNDEIVVKGNVEMIASTKKRIMTLFDDMYKHKKIIDKIGMPSYLRSNPEKLDNFIKGKMAAIVLEEDDQPLRQETRDVNENSNNLVDMPAPVQSETFSFNDIEIMVTNQDILALNGIDAVVNCANTKLNHVGGFAHYLQKHGGYEVRQTSLDYVKKNGELSPGEAVKLPAGNLPFKFIIHAVGPVYNNTKVIESTLFDCVWAALKEAERARVASIAIPGISCGVYAFPPHLATEIIVQAICSYFKRENPSSIRKVYLIDTGERVHRGYLRAARSAFSGTLEAGVPTTHRGANAQPPTAMTETGKPKGNFKATEDPSKLMTGNVSVVLVQGDIAAQQADAIINTTHPRLELCHGAASKCILATAGAPLQAECTQLFHSNGGTDLYAPQFVCSSGHQLKSKFIYHGSFKAWGGNAERKSLENLLAGVLTDANGKGLTSICIPAIGTGQLNYPPEEVARIIYEVIDGIAPKLTKLKTINIILFPGDVNTIQAFQDHVSVMLGKRTSARQRGEYKSNPSSEEILGGKSAEQVEVEVEENIKLFVKDITIELVMGDITEEKTSAVVNSTSSPISLKEGVVAQAICRKGGKEVENAVNKAKMTSGVAMTTSGNMKCKKIIHLDAQSKEQGNPWKSRMKKVLKFADKEQFTSLSVPALGTGNLNNKFGDMAEDLIGGIVECCESSLVSLKLIRLVIFRGEVFKEFAKVLTSKEDNKFMAFIKAIPLPFFVGSERKVVVEKVRRDQLILHVYTFERKVYDEISVEIDGYIKELVVTVRFSEHPELIKALDRDSIEQLVMNGRSRFDVRVNVMQGPQNPHIEIQGMHEKISIYKDHLWKFFTNRDRDLLEQASANLITDLGVIWKYEEDNGTWKEYDRGLNLKIEKSFSNKEMSCEWQEAMDDDIQNIKIIFLDMVEVSPHGRLNIKRCQNGEDMPLPESWDDMGDLLHVLVDIAPGSAEYNDVTTQLMNSAKNSVGQILKVQRVQNVTLFRLYEIRKKQIEKEIEGTNLPLERPLWHRSDQATILKICKDGFNRSYCGSNASCSHGEGTYFAVNSNYSPLLDITGSQNTRDILLCKVATGDFCQGQSGQKYLGPRRNGIGNFHSSVDKMAAPNMFIVYHDAQAYPEYLINFT